MNKRQKIVQKQFLNNESEVLRRLEETYGRAQKDVLKRIENLQIDIDELNDTWADFEGTDEEKDVLRSRIQSKIYQRKHQEAIQGQIDDVLNKMHKGAFTSVSEYLEKCYEDGFLGTLYDIQGQGVPFVFPIDQEAVARAVQIDSKISKNLYTKMGENVSDLKKHITAEVSRGLANGSSYEQVAQQISFKMTGTYNKTGGALARAQTIARTEGHRVEIEGTMAACYKAKDKGADVVKQWDSTLDAKTRSSHVSVDGEIRELDEKFSNGLRFPSDSTGGAAEVVNCRCALLQRARWALEDEEFTKMNGFTGELETFNKDRSYSDFKKDFFSKENREYMTYVEGLEQKYGTRDFEKLLGALDDKEYKRYTELFNKNPMYIGAKSKKILENSVNSDIIKLPDILIGKSVGAKANTYDVLDLATGEIYHFVEGSRLQNVEVFAGKGTHSEYRNAYKYADRHGGDVENWQHVKGIGLLETADGETKAEVHWSQCEGIGKFDFFVKRWLE